MPSIACLVGAALRFYRLDAQSLWFDEAFAVHMAQLPIGQILTTQEELGHPPLYYIALHYWIRLAGTSEFAIRFLSLLPGFLTIPASYALGRRLANREVGLIMAVAAALSPFFVFYSQETRMYGALALWSILSTYLLVRALDGDARAWIAYAGVATLLVYTHYYGLLLLAGQAVYTVGLFAIEGSRGRLGWRAVAHWLAAGAFAALLFAPWAVSRAYVFDEYASVGVFTLDVGQILAGTVAAFCLGHLSEAFGADLATPDGLRLARVILAMCSGFVAVAGYGLVQGLRARRAGPQEPDPTQSRVYRSLALTVTIILCALALLYALSVGRRAFSPRYLTILAPSFYFLVALGLDQLRRRSRRARVVAVALLVLPVAGSFLDSWGQWHFARDDFRSAVAYVDGHPQPNAVVVCDAGYADVAVRYYLKSNLPIVALTEKRPMDQPSIARQLADLSREHRFVWLVLWQDYVTDRDQVVQKWLGGNARQTDAIEVRGGIRVQGYVTQPDPVDPAAIPNPFAIPLDPDLSLVGYTWSPARAGQTGQVALYWRARAPIQRDLKVFVHVVDAAGRKLAQDDSAPQRGAYPTSRWEPGRVVMDEHPLEIPASAAPAEYRLEIGLYDPATMKRVGAAERDHLVLPDYRVER